MPRASRFTPLDQLPVVVLDTETTGLDVSSCRLLQISGVWVADGQVVRARSFDRLVNPGVPIPPRSTTIHGISDAMVATAPPFAEVWPEIDRFLDAAVIVGQSIGFDLAVLLRETQRVGATWRRPQFLDTKLLMAALDPEAGELGLDTIAARLGVPITDRHTALGDALVTAEIFIRLLPRLAAAGIRTLGEAEARSNALQRIRSRQQAEGWYDASTVRPADPFESGASDLARVDSFAYRHRVAHVMRPAPTLLPPSATLAEAIRHMVDGRLHAVLAGDPAGGRVDGIVSQRDVLTALAHHGAAGLDHRLETLMSQPVATIPRDAFLYRAVARMQRLHVGQLPVEDAGRRIVGMLSLRDLLTEEAGQPILLGDKLSNAPTPRALASARAELPALARQLRADEVPAAEIATVLAAEWRELLARAAVLAEKRMETEGAGQPPVAYALLALGRVGRGESLLHDELEHAIVFASGAPDGFEARWFETFAAHVLDVLRGAEVAASGGASAGDAAWRRSLEGWRSEIERWAIAPAAGAAEPFFDFRLAYGDEELAEDLRSLALAVAAGAPDLVRALSPGAPPAAAEAAIDLAGAGLRPIEAAARALALATGVRLLGTGERLAEVVPRSGLSRSTADELIELHERLLDVLLHQQQQALAAGRPASGTIDLAALDDGLRAEVRAALEHTGRLRDIVRLARALI